MIFSSLALVATLLVLRVADVVAAAEPTTAEALALLPQQQQQQQQQQEEHRQLQNSFEVIAYRCNEDYEEDKSGRPLERDQSIRICIETTRPTKLQDVYILKINTFRFFKKEAARSIRQDAVDSGAEAFGGQTDLEECVAGSEVCTFKTKLRDAFFDTDGSVDGVGTIAMQSGKNRRLVEVNLRGTNNEQKRQMQDFAGMVGCTMSFDVEDGFNKKKIEEARYSFQEHWHDQPASVQGLYVLGILVLVILLCCVCAGLILWRKCCSDLRSGQWIRTEQWIGRDDEAEPNSSKGDEHSVTYSVDDDEDWGEEDDDDDEDEQEESHHSERSLPPSSRRSNKKPSKRKMLSYAEESSEQRSLPPSSHRSKKASEREMITSAGESMRSGTSASQHTTGDAIVLYSGDDQTR